MSLTNLILYNTAKIFDTIFSPEEYILKFFLDTAYGAIEFDNPHWDDYYCTIDIAYNNLQRYNGRFKDNFERYYQKIKKRESLKK